MKKQQDGFSLSIVYIGIALLAAVGVAIFVSKQSNKTIVPAKNIVSSYAECIAAGNPVLKTYPSQCVSGVNTFTNPNEKASSPPVATTSNNASWFLYESKSYSVRLPDGWQLVTIDGMEDIYGRTAGNTTQKPGTKATVTAITAGGWDGPSAFSLYLPTQNYDQIVRKGVEQGTVQATSGQKAHMYYYVQESASEGPDYQMGDKVYNYYFDADGKYIQVSHTVGSINAVDQHETVEKIIQSLIIK